MPRSKAYAKAAILSIIPALAMLLALGGCGGSSTPDENPEISSQRKQARIDAYGKNGVVNSRGSGKGGGMSAQAAARRANGR